VGDVVGEVVTVRQGAEEAEDVHYFEVHLEKVIRLKSDTLLNEQNVSGYLSQVAPVPFSEDFQFSGEIEEHLSAFVPVSSYYVQINGANPLVRSFRNEFAVTLTKQDQFESLERITLADPDAGVVAVGWILHHNYLGAIQATPEVAGLRARVGNIQIGGSDIFTDIFPEARFNAWTVGEIHVLDPRVLPNGRRDNFERNAASAALVHRLHPHGRDVARHCRSSSTHRVQLKKFAAAETKAGELLDILEQGALGTRATESLRREVGGLFGEMEKLAGGLALDAAAAELQDRLAQLRTRFDVLVQLPAEVDPASGPLARIPEHNRDAFTWAVELIYECASNRGAAKALVDRMMARVTGKIE
jgi:molecular chaperone HtpG